MLTVRCSGPTAAPPAAATMPVRLQLKPAQPARALRLPVHAASRDPLPPWQAKRLHAALKQGRRQVKVRELAGELGMEREDVIHWLKEINQMPDSLRESMQESAEAAVAAEAERKQALREEKEKTIEKKLTFAERQAAGGDFAKKRMSKATRDTLESVWDKTRWPNEEVIRGIYKLHRLPRGKVLDWFAAKRAEESHSQRRKREDNNDVRFTNNKPQ